MSSRPSRGAARLAAILDALPDALLLVNCNGTVVNANTIALEAFETPGTALVGRGLLDLLPEFDSKRIPGSMRRPEEAAAQARERQKPTRMVARRTDGTEFPVEVTSANLEDGRTPYASAIEAAFADHGVGGHGGYTGDELLMLVVRDLTGTLDTEAELARQQRQTEMILRAASEGVVGVDAEGNVVLVNPAAAQILGYRASDLGGQSLHPLIHHSRPDGSPLPYEETPLADTLRSGRKHRMRVGQVLWAKDGRAVPVDMTTAPVRDGEQLVGAVLTFADRRPYDEVAARQSQLRAVLEDALREPLEQLHGELAGLASDPAGQLWPEANQILHSLSAGYARMRTLVDNVLSYQRLDSGKERLSCESVPMDAVVSAGVEGAVELIGPGRAQFAVHAPPIEAEVDPERLAVALAHLIADVVGVDATGRTPTAPPPGVDPTIVVAAAQRGDVVRIEVRGPYGGGSPVHEPLVRGIVARHGGVLQTHEVPGAAGGSAYVLEVPVVAAQGNASRSARPRARARTQAAGTGAGTDGDTGGGTGGGGSHARGRGPGSTGGRGRGRARGAIGAGGSGGAGGLGAAGDAGSAGGVGAAGSSGDGGEGGAVGGGALAGPGFQTVRGTDTGETTVMPAPAAPARGTAGQARQGGAAGPAPQGAAGPAWGPEHDRGEGPASGPGAGPGSGPGPGTGPGPGPGAGSGVGGRPARELEPAGSPGRGGAPGGGGGAAGADGEGGEAGTGSSGRGRRGDAGDGPVGAGSALELAPASAPDPRQGPAGLGQVPDPRQSRELGPGPSAEAGAAGPGAGPGADRADRAGVGGGTPAGQAQAGPVVPGQGQPAHDTLGPGGRGPGLPVRNQPARNAPQSGPEPGPGDGAGSESQTPSAGFGGDEPARLPVRRRPAPAHESSQPPQSPQSSQAPQPPLPSQSSHGAGFEAVGVPRPTGRRRGRPSPVEEQQGQYGQPGQYEQAGQYEQQERQVPESGADEGRGSGSGTEAGGGPGSGPFALPPAGSGDVPVPAQGPGRRARRMLSDPAEARADVTPDVQGPGEAAETRGGPVSPDETSEPRPSYGAGVGEGEQGPASNELELPPASGGGRRARRIAAARARAQAEAEAQQGPQHAPFALPPVAPTAEEGPEAGQMPPAGPASAPAPALGPGPAAGAGTEAGSGGGSGEPDAAASYEYGLNGVGAPAPSPVPHAPAQGTGPGPDAGPGPDPGEELGPEQGQARGGSQPESGSGSERRAEHSVVAASPILGGAYAQQHQLPSQPHESHQSQGAQSTPMPEHGHSGAGGVGPYGPEQGPLVRTLGQGVPFSERVAEQAAYQWHGQPPGASSPASAIPSTPSTPPAPPGSGRRRKLATPQERQEEAAPGSGQEQAGPVGRGETGASARPQPGAQPTGRSQNRPGQQGGAQLPAVPGQNASGAGPLPGPMPQPRPQSPPQPRTQAQPPSQSPQQPQSQPPSRPPHGAEGGGGNGDGPPQYAVGASVGPSLGEGPEPLDGPDSPVEVSDGRGLSMPPYARDDELPPEPLDNPRRLLVWPEPDVSTQQALSERGYRPVLVHSREEVDAQIAAYPAALFVDPLTGPITRTALQSLRTAAVAAEVPVLVTAGLGQATREAAYGADPAVLLKALAPRDSEQHPPRVLLVEENHAIAGAFAATLERRGMQVAHAPTDAEAVNIAAQSRPNLVVMDLMQVRRRRAGIIDWLRVNGLLNRTPFVVYTSADMDPGELHRLASGETVLFLAERSTSSEVQSRIVDLLTKIGAN